MNEKNFIHNLKNGFIVSTMLIAYSESFVNSIMRLEYNNPEDTLYMKSTKDKLDLLYKKEGVNNWFNVLNVTDEYKQYSTICTIRNELIHYKISTKEHASRLADFEIAKRNASSLFSRSFMLESKHKVIGLAKMIAHDLGYGVKDDMPIVSSDGMDIICNYVYNLKWLELLQIYE